MEPKLTERIFKHLAISDINQVVIAIRSNPLPVSIFQHIVSRIRFSTVVTAQILGMPEDAYRSLKPSDVLSIHNSEMTYRLAVLYDTGLMVFDNDRTKLLWWMHKPTPALSGLAPVTLVNSIMGIELVREELLRIEYSMFS